MILKIKRALTKLLAAFIIFIIILLSPIGLHLAGSLAHVFLPGKLKYGYISDQLIGPIKLHNVSYSYQGNSVKVKNFYLQWSPAYLLIGKIHINRIRAKHAVIITVTPEKNKPKPFFAFLNHLAIKHVKIDDLKIKSYKEKTFLTLQQLTFDSRVKENNVKVNLNVKILNPYKINIDAKATGNLDHYILSYKIRSKDFNWNGEGSGDSSQLSVKSLKGDTLGGQFISELKLQFLPTLYWDATLKINNIHLHHLQENLPKNISGNIHTKGQLINNVPQFNFDADLLGEKTKIKISGTQNNGWKISWDANIEQFSSLVPSVYGKFKTEGELHGDLANPDSRGSFMFDQFIHKKINIEKLGARWNINFQEKVPSTFILDGTNVAYNKLRFLKLILTANGTRAQHSVNGEWKTLYTKANFNFNGSLIHKIWTGTLNEIHVSSKRYGLWQLKQNNKIVISKLFFNFSPLCFASSNNASLCFSSSWQDGHPWQGNLQGNQINIDIFNFLLPINIDIDTKLNVTASLIGYKNWLQTGSIDITTKPGQLKVATQKRNFESKFEEGSIKTRIGANGIHSNIRLKLPGNNVILAMLALPKYQIKKIPEKDQPLEGSLQLDWRNLLTLTGIITHDIYPSGNLDAKFNLAGTLEHPTLTGYAKIQNGTLKIPQHGIEVTHISANLKGEGHSVNFEMKGASAGSMMIAKGNLQLEPGFPIDVTLTGKDILFINTAQYTLYASPNLNAKTSYRTLSLTGSIDIPRGIIQPNTFNNTVKLPSNDIEYIGSRDTEFPTRWQIFSNLTITAGKNVKINSNKLTGRIEGELHVNGKPQYPLLANGRVSLYDGIFTAYGAKLTLVPGSSIFYTANQPIENPSLDLRAYKIIKTVNNISGQDFYSNEITVGLHATGTLKHPEMTFYSSPVTLSQADIMSYLVFGTVNNSNTPGNLTLLLDVINLLQSKQNSVETPGLTEQLQQNLGLSEFGVETQSSVDVLGNPIATRSQNFVVGRYVLPSLYLRYCYDTMNAINIFQVRYLFRHNWAIQAESSTATNNTFDGFDLLYTMDRGSYHTTDSENKNEVNRATNERTKILPQPTD